MFVFFCVFVCLFCVAGVHSFCFCFYLFLFILEMNLVLLSDLLILNFTTSGDRLSGSNTF